MVGILAKNREVNLTHITDMESAWVLHINDALEAVPEINQAPDGWLVDLGSGGGFPGIPLAVATGRQTLLVDSRAKKMKAVQAIANQAGIGGVHVFAGRIEQLASEQREHFAVAVARALAKLPVLLELASPLLLQDGLLVAYKTEDCSDEISQADILKEMVGLERIGQRSYNLGVQYGNRQIVIYRKFAPASVALPRRIGVAQKKPLIPAH